MVREVSSLAHESRNDTVERRSGVSKSLFSSTKSAEVFGSLGAVDRKAMKSKLSDSFLYQSSHHQHTAFANAAKELPKEVLYLSLLGTHQKPMTETRNLHYIGSKFHDNTAGSLATDRHIKVNLRIRHLAFSTCFVCVLVQGSCQGEDSLE